MKYQAGSAPSEVLKARVENRRPVLKFSHFLANGLCNNCDVLQSKNIYYMLCKCI